MKKLSFLLIASSVIVFQACKDEAADLPVITVTTPAELQEFEPGDTVFVNGTVTHTADLHEYKIEMKRIANDSVVYTNTTHVDVNSVNFSEYWVHTLIEHSDMLLTVTATDHDGNSSTKEVHFHCHEL